jgi:hypothetical protein
MAVFSMSWASRRVTRRLYRQNSPGVHPAIGLCARAPHSARGGLTADEVDRHFGEDGDQGDSDLTNTEAVRADRFDPLFNIETMDEISC